MARTTVEDCLDKIPNRYELVLLACKRAHQINQMAQLMISSNSNDTEKPTVLALREIAAGKVTNDNIDSLAPSSSRDHDIAVNDAFVDTEPNASTAEVVAPPPDASPWVAATTDTIQKEPAKDEAEGI